MAGQNCYVDGLLNIPGMKFVPEEHHLLQFYLSRKINGEPLPWNGIRDFDIYGEQGPWELIHGETSSEPAYAFAISKNLGPKMKKRTCKFGTWKLQNKNSPVTHQGETIGWKAYLSFIPDKKLNIDPNFLGGSWNMNEYSLPGYQEKERFVFCRVTFHASTEKKRATAAAAASSSHVDATVRPRKRTKVACGSGNNWGGEAPCASVSSSYSNRDHCSSVVVRLEAPCDIAYHNLETNTVAEQLSHASESWYSNCGDLDQCTSSSIVVEEQSPPAACPPSCSDQEINATAEHELDGPCNFSSYNPETNTIEWGDLSSACAPLSSDQKTNTTSEWVDLPAACAPSCSVQDTATKLEGPCNFSSYNFLERNTVAERSPPAASCSGQEINAAGEHELESPCDWSCFNWETNSSAEQPFPWLSDQERCAVEKQQPPSPYALSYYDAVHQQYYYCC